MKSRIKWSKPRLKNMSLRVKSTQNVAVPDDMEVVPDGTSVQKREKHQRCGAGRAGECAGQRATCAGRHNPPVAYDVKTHFRAGRHVCCVGRHVRRDCEIIFHI